MEASQREHSRVVMKVHPSREEKSSRKKDLWHTSSWLNDGMKHTHTHTHKHTHTHTDTHTHIHTDTHTNTHTHTQKHTHSYTQRHTHSDTQTYITGNHLTAVIIVRSLKTALSEISPFTEHIWLTLCMCPFEKQCKLS